MIRTLNRLFVLAFILFASFSVCAKDFTVIIDAGHGGKDFGALGERICEKHVNLAVAIKLGNLIHSEYKDVRVIYTRSTDTFITLQQRADIANRYAGDLFISIHCNSVDKKNKNRNTISGAATYTLGLHKTDENFAVAQRENSVIVLEDDYTTKYQGFDPNSSESYIMFELNQNQHLAKSVEFASNVQQELSYVAGRKDNGVRQAGFWVLAKTAMPSVLVELDFICNPNQETYLASKSGQELLATGVFNAFKSFKSAYDNRVLALKGGKARTEITKNGKTDWNDKKPAQSEAQAKTIAQAKADAQVAATTATAATATTSKAKTETKPTRTSATRKNRRKVEEEKKEAEQKATEAVLPTAAAAAVAVAEAPKPAEEAKPKKEEKAKATIPVAEAPKPAVDGKPEMPTEEVKPAAALPVVAATNEAKKEEKAKPAKETKPAKEKPAKQSEAEPLTKQIKEKEYRQEKGIEEPTNANAEEIEFRVQIMATTTKIPDGDSQFKGLSPVGYYSENGLYKYTFGTTTNKKEALSLLQKVKEKFSGAFLVKFKNGNKIK